MCNKNKDFYFETDVNINFEGSDVEPLEDTDVQDSIKSIYVKIEAARSGRMTDNYSVYTPKAMNQGVRSFVYPFNKHLQSKHNGEAVGVIREAEHVQEFFPRASQKFLDIVDKLNHFSEISDGPNLIRSVKKLIETPEYKSKEYRGLGITSIYGDIYDPTLIYNLKTQNRNKGKVSIGGKSKEVYCSVCESAVRNNHEHRRGNYYKGELCFYVNNDLYLDHCGFVTRPADSYTNTEIVQDSASSELEVDILNYKLTNSLENLMKIEDLKQKAKDIDSVNKLIDEAIKDEKDAELAKSVYKESLKNSRSNHHLLTKEKILNLKTPVGIYLGEKLLEDFDPEDKDKQYLKEVIDKAKTILKIENTDTALEESINALRVAETEKLEDDKKTETEEDKSSEDSKEETKKDTESESEVKDEDTLLSKISSLIDEKLTEFVKGYKVEDQDSNAYLKEELLNLRQESSCDEKAIEALTKQCTTSLIDQIVLLKGSAVSEGYLSKLNNRSLDHLKITLEDLKEELVQVGKDKTIVTDLEKTTQTEALNKVEDQLQNQQTEDNTKTEETSDTEEAAEKPAETEETEDQKVEDGLKTNLEDLKVTFQKRIGEIGLSRATKEFNIAKNKGNF